MDLEEHGKPVVDGPVDGNAFAVLGAARRAMRRAGVTKDKIDEMVTRATAPGNDYDRLLVIVQEYVEFNL